MEIRPVPSEKELMVVPLSLLHEERRIIERELRKIEIERRFLVEVIEECAGIVMSMKEGKPHIVLLHLPKFRGLLFKLLPFYGWSRQILPAIPPDPLVALAPTMTLPIMESHLKKLEDRLVYILAAKESLEKSLPVFDKVIAKKTAALLRALREKE